MINNIVNENKPIMYILAGPNGSGKTSVLMEKIPKDTVILNADVFSKEIAKEHGIRKEKVQAVVNDSDSLKLAGLSRLAERMQQSIHRKETFAVETTLDVNAYRNKYINNAKSNGFEINLLYVGTESAIINISRVKNRVADGGHHVSQEEVVKRYHGSLGRLSNHIEIVDIVNIYDNTEEPLHILSIYHCKIIDINKPIPKWVNESINKKLFPGLYKEVLDEYKKETIYKAREKLDINVPIVNAKQGETYEGKIVSKSPYYAVQELPQGLGIAHELEKVVELKNRGIGENVAIKYDNDGTAKILESNVPNMPEENSFDEEHEI